MTHFMIDMYDELFYLFLNCTKVFHFDESLQSSIWK